MGWRYRMDLEYDGADFSGWQIVPRRRTVQGTLEQLLGKVGERARPKGAARTDAGVHALVNTAHADLEREWEEGELAAALRSLAPADLRIRAVRRVDSGFHARYNAVERRYVYALAREEDTFFRGRRWRPRRFPPAAWAEEELGSLVGETDCTSFARAEAEVNSHRCAVRRAAWHEVEGGALLVLAANRFLYGMVRTVVGSLVRGTRDGCPKGYLRGILAARDRQAAGEAVPPQGLYLAGVCYGGEYEDPFPLAPVLRAAGLGTGRAGPDGRS